MSYEPWYTRHHEAAPEPDPCAGLKQFFEELPTAVISYSTAVGVFSLAAIIVRIAVHLFFNV